MWVGLCLALGTTTPASTPDVSSRLAGSIRDSVGQVIDGVEVLIVRKSSTVDPVAIASTDHWGRFAVPDLAPGVYSIAALKQGYGTFIGNVDTRIQRFVEVILYPMPDAGHVSPGTVPEDAAWLLRLPRRTVFRDTEPGTDGGEEPVAATRYAGLPTEAPINLRVDQLFAVGAPFPSRNEEPVKLQGNETRVRLATPIGERGSLRLDGQRESLGSSLKHGGDASASSEVAGLGVDFTYDLGSDSRLAVRASFDEHGFEWGEPALPLESNRRSWGYESEWQRQLNDLSSLRVHLDYAELDYDDDALRLQHLGGLAGGGAPAFAPGRRELEQRTVVAGAEYDGLAAGRHQLGFGFKARLFEASGPEGPDGTGSAPIAAPGPGAEGYALHLNARDAWAMSGPFTLLYGLGYKHALTDRDLSVIVPSLGGAWAVDRLALRFTLSYHASSQQGRSGADTKYGLAGATPETAAISVDGLGGGAPPRSDLGYAAEVEFPITGTLRVRGSSSFIPIQLPGIDVPQRPAGTWDHPAFLGDGMASRGATSLYLEQDLGDARTWVEFSRGRSRGLLALGAGRPMVFPTLTDGAATFANGRWGFQIIPSGTDLQVEYRRVVESQQAEDGASLPMTEREMVELRLIQSLMRFHGLGNWRLLMAVRMARHDTEDEGSWAEGTDPAVLRAFNEGVSAGLSVSF